MAEKILVKVLNDIVELCADPSSKDDADLIAYIAGMTEEALKIYAMVAGGSDA